MDDLENFFPEKTTVWDFPIRGNWLTHKSDYRGNFAPQIPRNVMINYSTEGELILDPMVGSGTTLIEARSLNRNAIGFDINEYAVNITKERLRFNVKNNSKQIVSVGDVRSLTTLENNSVDLIVTHPPYWNLVEYSGKINTADLSSINKLDTFFSELDKGISELFRVLKENHFCAILMGDTRKGQHFIPLSQMLLIRCLKHGFVLKEDIIKTQHNTRNTPRWINSAKNYRFYLIMHEHLFIFRKPRFKEKLSPIKYSGWDGINSIISF